MGSGIGTSFLMAITLTEAVKVGTRVSLGGANRR